MLLQILSLVQKLHQTTTIHYFAVLIHQTPLLSKAYIIYPETCSSNVVFFHHIVDHLERKKLKAL